MASRPDISKGEGLIRTYDVFQHLSADSYKSFEILDLEKDSQYLRRAVVRNVFSFIEGIVQILKFEVKSDLKMNRYSYSLSKNDLEVLNEEKENNGNKFQLFIPIDENLKKTFSIASNTWGLHQFKLDLNSEGYQDFLLAKKTRNRLTHPRTFYDIDITDNEITCFYSCFLWANTEFLRIMKLKVESIAEELPAGVYEKLSKA